MSEGDSFSETSEQGWLSRMGDAIKGVLIGLLLFIVSFPLLFWNEGRAVHTAQGLAEGEKSVVRTAPDKVDPANENKLVHLSGLATTEDVLKDTDFDVSAKAIKLERKVEMYQWVEKEEKKTEKKLGGKEVTTTTYNYDKKWSPDYKESSKFKHPEGHENPMMPYQKRIEIAKVVTLGAFQLSDSLVADINKAEPLKVDDAALAKLPSDLKDKVKVSAGEFYLAHDPANKSGDAQLGDMKVSFAVVNPTDVSILARQVGKSFEPYKTSVEGSPLINRLQLGKVSADEMFKAAEAENNMITWILRLVGYILMAVGIGLVFNPLIVMADVIPLVGNILSYGVFFFAALMALPFTLITIALGWIVYRPLLGGALLAVAVLLIVGMVMMGRKKAPAKV